MSISVAIQSFVRYKRRLLLLRGLCCALALDGGLLLAGCVLDNLAGFGQLARYSLLGCFVLLQVLLLARFVKSFIGQNGGKRRNARELEQALQVNDNAIVNAVCFEDKQDVPETLRGHFSRLAEQRLQERPLASCLTDQRLRKYARCLAFVALPLLLYGLLFGRYARNAMLRLFQPGVNVASLNFVQFDFKPGSVEVPWGSNVTLQGFAWKDGKKLPGLKLRVMKADGQPILYSLDSDGSLVLERVVEKLRCTLVARRESSVTYTIRPVKPRPPGEFSVAITPPEYTGLASTELHLLKGSLPAVVAGSRLQFKTDQEGVRLLGADKEALALPCSMTAEQGAHLAAELPLKGGTYGSFWEDELRVMQDAPPKVHFLNENTNIEAGYGELIAIDFVSEDDLGVAWQRLSVLSGAGATETPLHEYSYEKGGVKAARETFPLKITPELLVENASIELRVTTRDGLGQQVVTGRNIHIHYRELKNNLSEADGKEANCYAKLLKAFQQQKAARDYVTDNLRRLNKGHGTQLKQRQEEINKLMGLAYWDASSAKLKASLVKGIQDLKRDYAALLVLSAQSLMDLFDNPNGKELTGRKANEVVLTQTAFLEKLQKLLNEAALEEQKKEEQQERKAQADAEKEQYEALKELKERVDDFLEKQRQLIKETPGYDPAARDDLSEENEKLLGDLAMKEDELLRYLKEAFSDFSKKSKQDFITSDMADEFSQLYEELQRAGEALKMKLTVMPTFAEQNAADSAVEISENLERWLMDTQDRFQWLSEEDGLTQDTDLRDLPDELTDIIGDLVETEDEADAMPDSTSNSFTFDTDVGLGYAAMDGTIDSMQAKGITGSNLPKNNEVGGRSGEGRSGRSHGQFVEREFDGKGGRKTPTRLTDSPFEQGTVKDNSKGGDNGGSTGGGKQSGIGGEGLVGQTPDQSTRSGIRSNAIPADLEQRVQAAYKQLKERNLPAGDMYQALRLLQQSRNLGGTGGVDTRQLRAQVLQKLQAAQAALNAAVSVEQEKRHTVKKSPFKVNHTENEKVPDSCENLVGDYFKALSVKE